MGYQNMLQGCGCCGCGTPLSFCPPASLPSFARLTVPAGATGIGNFPIPGITGTILMRLQSPPDALNQSPPIAAGYTFDAVIAMVDVDYRCPTYWGSVTSGTRTTYLFMTTAFNGAKEGGPILYAAQIRNGGNYGTMTQVNITGIQKSNGFPLWWTQPTPGGVNTCSPLSLTRAGSKADTTNWTFIHYP